MLWIAMFLRWRNGGTHQSSTNPAIPIPIVVLVLGALIGFGIYATTLTSHRSINSTVPIEARALPIPHAPARQMAEAPAPMPPPGAALMPMIQAGRAPAVPAPAADGSVLPTPPSDDALVPAALARGLVARDMPLTSPPPPPGESVDVLAAKPPAVQALPTSPTPDSFTDAVSRLAVTDWSTRFKAIQWLTRQKPAADELALGAAPLIDLIGDPDPATSSAAESCLEKWASPAMAPAVAAKIPEATGETRIELLKLAVKIPAPEVATAVAGLLANADAHLSALQCMIDMGPAAEAAATELLKNEMASLRHDGCAVLQEVGTKASMPLLKALTHSPEKDKAVQAAAGMAIASIQRRGK